MQRAAHASGPSASWLWDPVDIGGFHEHPPYIGNNSTIICMYIYILVGGLEHVFFHVSGILMIPTDEVIFFRGVDGRYTTNQT